jgi:hypothetical protein
MWDGNGTHDQVLGICFPVGVLKDTLVIKSRVTQSLCLKLHHGAIYHCTKSMFSPGIMVSDFVLGVHVSFFVNVIHLEKWKKESTGLDQEFLHLIIMSNFPKC